MKKIPLPANIKNKQYLILNLLVGSIFVVGYINIFLRPTLAGFGEVTPLIAEFNNKIKQVEQWKAERPQSEQQLKSLQSKLAATEQGLSGEDRIPYLLGELSEIAKSSGVRIIGIKPVTLPEGKTNITSYREIPISIVAKCGYHQLGKFISELESADRLFVVRNIEIIGNAQTPRSHDVNLVVCTYLLL